MDKQRIDIATYDYYSTTKWFQFRSPIFVVGEYQNQLPIANNFSHVPINAYSSH